MSQFESQFEADLYRARLDTLEKIVALGQQAYPNHFAFTTDIPTIKQRFEPLTHDELEAQHPTAAIAGRIVAIRLQGKAGFATLQQGGQRLQIYVRKDDVGDTAFDLYKLLDLGDHIGVTGTLMRTRTGELTLKAAPVMLPGDEAIPGPEIPAVRAAPVRVAPVRAAPLTFLTKALLPLPDKYSGLGDIELRYRRRYLDLFTDTGDSAEPATEAGAPGLVSETWDGPPQPPSKGHGFSRAVADHAEHGALAPEGSKGHGFSRAVTDHAEHGALAPEGKPTHTRLPAREVFTKRAAILRSIRRFFDARNYLEVETPMLHTIAGGAAARPFTTHHNALDIPLSLRIAPELYLKRLVVGGLDRVYEINRNFRNEGVSTQHNPEFTMLEFYQAYANYHDLMDLTQELITTVAKEVNGTTITKFSDHEIDLSKWTKVSMREAIIKWWPPESDTRPTPDDLANLNNFRPFVEKLMAHFAQQKKRRLVEREDIHGAHHAHIEKTEAGVLDTKVQIQDVTASIAIANANRWTLDRHLKFYDGKVYASVFEMLAEEHLIQPTIIYDFPLAVSPLSKVKPDEPDWVERFEFYIGGFEVGNAFSELNDPADQLARFEAQVADKDPESMAAVDEDYVRALGYGLPPTAGEGIGIDRLTMILTGSRSIRDVILFPLMRPHQTPNAPPDNGPSSL